MMIKIYIVADSYKHFNTSIKEYEKRLWKTLIIEKVKCEKNGTILQIVKKETDNIISKLEKDNSFKIVLNPKWKEFTTEKFYIFMEEKYQNFWKISFIIWWANGIDYEKMRKHIDFEISLWKMTMPHSLAFLVLLEQIYRISMIKKGTKYHK